nr:hypothetical protein CFP56_56464 [Quercus suber]
MGSIAMGNTMAKDSFFETGSGPDGKTSQALLWHMYMGSFVEVNVGHQDLVAAMWLTGCEQYCKLPYLPPRSVTPLAADGAAQAEDITTYSTASSIGATWEVAPQQNSQVHRDPFRRIAHLSDSSRPVIDFALIGRAAVLLCGARPAPVKKQIRLP